MIELPALNSIGLKSVNQMMESYVNDGKTAGMLSLVSYQGKIIHFASHGYQNLEFRTPISADTIYRIYSMTKPITSVVKIKCKVNYR